MEGQVTLFRMSAPLVWADGYVPGSGLSKMAVALGKILGGHSADGSTFFLDRSDFSMVCAQIMLTEAGIAKHVMGIGWSEDQKRSYIALTDGSIIKVEIAIIDGKMVVTGTSNEEAETKRDCIQVVAMHEAIRQGAIKALLDEKQIKEGDSYVGHVVADHHAAICQKPFGYGNVIITSKTGIVSGWKFAIDGIHLDSDLSGKMMFLPLSPEEINSEKKRYGESTTKIMEDNPFPVKIGEA